MIYNALEMKNVYKRERYLEKRKTLNENSNTSSNLPEFKNLSNPILFRSQIESFIHDCKSYNDAISLMEMLYDINNFALLEAVTPVITNELIPTIEPNNLQEFIDKVQESSLDDVTKDKFTETAKMYKSIDRIIKNHNNLSKRFNLSESWIGDSKAKCYKICRLVDTYSLTPFIKFNIALEELSYLGFIHDKSLSPDILEEHVTNYFLLRNNNSQEDIDSYKKALTESKVKSPILNPNLEFLFENSKIFYDESVTDNINKWKIDPNKNIQTLIELARKNYSDLISFNIILETINDFVDINNISDFSVRSIIEGTTESLTSKEAFNIKNILKENNIEDMNEFMTSIDQIIEANINDDSYQNNAVSELLSSDEVNKFKMHNLINDAQSVGEFLDNLEKTSMKESPATIKQILSSKDTLSESNLINQIDANGYLSLKIRSYAYENASLVDIYPMLENSIRCINNILYGRNSKVYYIMNENTFSFYIRSDYKVVLSEYQEALRGFSTSDIETLCRLNAYNEALDIINKSPLNLIIEKLNDVNYAAEVTANEVALIYEVLNPYLSKESNLLNDFISLCESEANPEVNAMKQLCSAIVHEEFNPFDDHMARLEFCAYDIMGITPSLHEAYSSKNSNNPAVGSNLQQQKKNISNNNTTDEKKDDKSSESKKSNTSDTKSDDIKEEDNEDETSDLDNNDDESVDKSEEPKEKKKISINDLKLAWQGIKSKIKAGSAKEQEMCRDLDTEYNHLLKNLKMAYTSDHREEIITGEVNHSLSKAIKIAIGLLGAGGATHFIFHIPTLIAPIVGAVALFAKSKYTSTKEKKLIIDEIDIELQVLEREINRAESSGSTKKYRQLLTIQKNLQRKRQEIYYGLALKGKRIPMQSTAGMRSRE